LAGCQPALVISFLEACNNAGKNISVFKLICRSSAPDQWADPHRPGPFDLISELMGQSFRKSIDRVILGRLFHDPKRPGRFQSFQKSRKKE